VTYVGIYGGSGGNAFTVHDTARLYSDTYINTGAGNDTVNVLGTTGTLFIDGNGGQDTVTVGDNHSLANIRGFVGLYNTNGATALTVDDSGDTAPRSADLYGASGDGFLDGLGMPQGGCVYWHPAVGGTGGVASVGISGGSGGNTFNVHDTAAGITSQLNSGAGADLVNVLATTGPLTIDGGGGNDTVIVGNAVTLQGIRGALTVTNPSGSTNLIVNDELDLTGRTATLTATALTGLSPAPINFELLNGSGLTVTGGSGGNTFNVLDTPAGIPVAISAGAGDDRINMLGVPQGTLAIDGGGGTNTLDYSGFPTGVTVDLATGTATAVAGGVRNIQNVVGGPGNNILVGDGNANVLVGGPGRNLLIGGGGPDTLVGGADEDILIGGSTAYDTDPVALQAIMAEWGRTDLAFADRVDHILNGGGLNDPYLLNPSTVFDDGAANTLTGGLESDLFFVGANDTITNPKDGDVVVNLGASPSPGGAANPAAFRGAAGVAPNLGVPAVSDATAAALVAGAARKSSTPVQRPAPGVDWFVAWDLLPLADGGARQQQ
jgi:Ca2+-binding RTX toxin-like protein